MLILADGDSTGLDGLSTVSSMTAPAWHLIGQLMVTDTLEAAAQPRRDSWTAVLVLARSSYIVFEIQQGAIMDIDNA